MSLMNYGFTKTASAKGSPSQPGHGKQKEIFEAKLVSGDKVKQKSPMKKTANSPKPKKANSSTTSTPSSKKFASKKVNDDEEVLSYSPFMQKSASDLSLPPQRVKMIMKSCPDVDIVPQEALHIITKATELFIQNLAQDSLDSSNDKYRLDYESLSKHVHSTANFEFLKETIPKKLTLEECQKIIAQNRSSKSDDIL